MLERFRSKLPRKMRHSRIWESSSPKAQKRLSFERNLVLQDKKKKIPNWRQLRYLSSFFSARERAFVLVSVILILAGLASGGYFAYLSYVMPVPAVGGTYREALVGNPLYVNPILANTNDVDLDLSSLVYSGLLRKDKDQTFQPDLAESWELSDDRKTYTVHLRQGVTWQDGEPLTVDDVVFTYRAIQEPAVNSPLQASLQSVQVKKVDDTTIQFVLEKPFTPFISVLTTGIIPQHLWANLPASNIRLAEFNIKPIGSGPWKFSQLEKDKQGNIHTYTLVPSENYYLQKPFIKELRFSFYPDFQTAVDALNNGQIDGLSYLPPSLAGAVNRLSEYRQNQLQLPQYTAIFLNKEKNAALTSKTLRKGLAQALDRERMLDNVLGGLGTVVNGPITPGMNGYNPDLSGYAFDAVAAQKQFEDAGWKSITADDYQALQAKKAADNKDGQTSDTRPADAGNSQTTYRQKDDQILEIKLTTVDEPQYVQAAYMIQNAWQTVGVKVTLDIVPVNVFLSNVLPARDYEALLYGQILNTPPDLYAFWHSSQIQSPGLNLARYADKDMDANLEKARQVAPPDLPALYDTIQKQLIDDVPAIFLYSPKYTYLQTKKLNGFNVSQITIPADRFSNLSDWYLKTKRVFKQ